ncbi:MAG: M48 family metallopeptidase [Burkholderiales bacterium]|nr:M48 family metallopeptidase [Burkholderiales bacterium]
MNFFEQQDAARRRTVRLVVLFLLAVAAIVLAVNIVAALVFVGVSAETASGSLRIKAPASFYATVTMATLALITGGSLVQILRLADGGAAVARMLGARPVSRSSTDPAERRLLNVVEEMAIASGTAVPQVFVMDDQPAINAFAAGYSPGEAAVVVTRGTLDTLNRDELQGVVGHEFSHIMNGDMRLNLHLMGVLGGILLLTTLGRILARSSSRSNSKGSSLVLLGFGLIAIGYIGVLFGRLIQASVSRQREFLADASSVQFTRNRDGIGGALAKIGRMGSRVTHPRTEAASHMFFSAAMGSNMADLFPEWSATHPPLSERLKRIYGRPVAISDIVARSAPITPEPAQAAALSGFALGNEFGRSALERRGSAAETQAVVKTGANAVIAAMGDLSTRHADYALSLLDALPQHARELTRDTAGSRQAMFGLVFALSGPSTPVQMDLLRAGGEDAVRVAAIAAQLQGLGRTARLPLIALATPTLKSLASAERAAFMLLLQQLVVADRRVTLEEFVVITMLDAALSEHAGRAVPASYRKLEQLAEDARLILSLVAHATDGNAATSFEHGLKELGIPLALLEAGALNLPAVKAALARLNRLALMQKPRLVKALVRCALAEGELCVTDAELLRAICSTLDSPLPPFFEAMPYAA